MEQSKITSEFLKHRVDNLVDKRLKSISEHIKNKDISELCKITMIESNSLHSVCLDTFPPLHYMNETSFFIVKCVNLLNGFYNKDKNTNIICGYSFDAGANAFIFTTEDKNDNIQSFLSVMLDYNNKLTDEDKILDELKNYSKLFAFDLEVCNKLYEEKKSKNCKIENLILFKPGVGAHLVE